jgi:hypothetical protein
MDILLAVPFFNGSFKNGRRSFHLVDYVSNVVEEFPSCFVMIWFDFRLRKPRSSFHPEVISSQRKPLKMGHCVAGSVLSLTLSMAVRRIQKACFA